MSQFHPIDLDLARCKAAGEGHEIVTVSKNWLQAAVAEISAHRAPDADERHAEILAAIDRTVRA